MVVEGLIVDEIYLENKELKRDGSWVRQIG